MERQAVYAMLDVEREYQNRKPERIVELDIEHSVADWVIYLDFLVEQAKGDIYSLNPTGALDTIRKIGAVCVACIEVNDQTPPRIIPDFPVTEVIQ